MKTINFEFLKPKWEALANIAGFAEQYVHADPSSALVKLRQFGEQVVEYIYGHHHLPRPYQDGLNDLLQEHTFKQIVPSVVLNKLHSLRVQGNKAARSFSTGQFTKVLRCLAAKELIEQMPQGDLILAPKGEQMVRHYSFYSAFASGIDYSVMHRSVPIGMLPADSLPKVDEHFILGGRRWQVVIIDDQRREIIVKRAKGRKPPRFFGSGGEIHQRIRQKMKEIVCSDRELQYLDEAASELLTQSRATAIAARLHKTSFVALSPTRCLWLTWTGTRIQRTLCLLAEHAGLPCTNRDVAIEFDSTGMVETIKKLASIASSDIDPIALSNLLPSKQFRKLDEMLSDELLSESLAVDFLDVKSAIEIIKFHTNA